MVSTAGTVNRNAPERSPLSLNGSRLQHSAPRIGIVLQRNDPPDRSGVGIE